MNYYQELGVGQNACSEEIRQAYKMMARLLHPDRQTDPLLKEIADRQMARLSEIVGLLTDPRTRSQYDDALSRSVNSDASHRNRARLVPASVVGWPSADGVAAFAVRYWFWVLSGAFVIVLSAWTLAQPKVSLPPHELRTEALPHQITFNHQTSKRLPKPSISSGISQQISIPSTGNALIDEESQTPVVVLPDRHSSPISAEPPRVVFSPPARSSDVALSADPSGSPSLPGESPFVGRWLYSPRTGDEAEQELYPAVYVELQVVERGGEMAGNYHGVYKVRDRAVSPEIAFQIRGAAGPATSAKFSWVARDHSSGEAEMTLQGPNVLYVNWWTTAFGRQATLGSGTSVLVRQQVP